MSPSFSIAIKICLALAILAMLRFGFVAATESDSRRKATARLIASLIFSSLVCLAPVAAFLYDWSLPIVEFTGKIDSVQVRNSSSRYYSAFLHIAIADGGGITVHASDRSAGFLPGQELKVRYRGDTGELIQATFYAPDGSKQGTSNRTLPFSRLVLLLCGLFCIWGSLRKYRRDPQGHES